MPKTLAMTGAGSIGFTRKLLGDVLAVPELADTHFAFHDLSAENLERVAQLCRLDIAAAGLPATISLHLDRREAFQGADYALCTIRQGGLEAFRTDIDIPLRYGIDQCVGDTLCAGGIFYGQRTIPELLGICRDLRECGRPGALLLNYSNPMAMNTWACAKYGGVPVVGLCHGVQGGHWQITRAVEYWLKTNGLLPRDYHTPGEPEGRVWEGLDFPFGMHRREVDVICAGINHQTWYVSVKWRGRDLLRELPAAMRAIPYFARTEKVRLDVLDRFGYYSTESNGHLSEYVPWYRKRPSEIPRWIDLSSWIHGETGGYLRVCTEGRNWFDTEFPKWLAEGAHAIGPARRSEEHGSYIIESLETGRPYRGHFNVVNRGHIPNLPDGCIVEIPGYVDGNGINLPVVGPLPLGCAATCAVSVRVQEMAMEAAVHGDLALLRLALLHDPLVGAVCNPEEVWQMADEMLVAQAAWLPQYAAEIEPARRRLAEHEARGTRVALRDTRGAARRE